MIDKRKITRWRRAMESADVVGLTEIVRRTGEKKGTVSMWLSRRHSNGFPLPVLELAAGRFFMWDEVAEWYTNYQPKSGTRKPPRLRVVRDVAPSGDCGHCITDTDRCSAEQGARNCMLVR